jgi:NDMA-dependent alcohol dehydrogenase
MKTHAAVLFGPGEEWAVEEIELDPPKAGELLVKFGAAGVCHSDESMRKMPAVPNDVMEQLGMELHPMVGGHEGAGVVVDTGPGVSTVVPGDHVAMSFMPLCGHCYYCASGRAYLCDNGARLMLKGMITDGTARHHWAGRDLNPTAKLGTWAEHSVVAETAVVKIGDHIPLTAAALVSCGVSTGFGSAVDRGRVKPGDVVVVVGAGGVGSNAIQGARIAGARHIIAVDPVRFKRDHAAVFGATGAVATMEEAQTLVAEITHGRLADVVVLTPGEIHPDHIAPALALVGKDGTVVVTAMSTTQDGPVSLSLFDLTMWNKALVGTLYGSRDPRTSIPALLSLYEAGVLKLDELITKVYSLDQVNEANHAMLAGQVIRAIITFD